jgi:hypothetical protein
MSDPCCDVDPSNTFNQQLLNKYQIIDKKEQKKQKQFFISLLSVNCDGDSYERCFEIADGQFLCRSCLSTVLHLPRRTQLAFVPSSKYIHHRYYMICMADVFSAIVLYRTSVLQNRPTRRDGTYKQRIEWSHPCFDEAKKKIYRMRIYRDHGIKHFVLHTGITSALKNNQIILGASGHDCFNSDFISATKGCFIDLTMLSHFSSTLDALHKIVLNFPPQQWN